MALSDYSPLMQRGLELVRLAADEDRAGMSREALKHYRLALEAFVAAIRSEKNPKIVSTVLPQVKRYMQRAEELQEELDLERLVESAEPPPTKSKPERAAANDAPQKALEPPLTASPFPPAPAPRHVAAAAAKGQKAQAQQQAAAEPAPEYSCLPTALFSSDQVARYAKAPQQVPEECIKATQERETQQKWFTSIQATTDQPPQQQQQQQQQEEEKQPPPTPPPTQTPTQAQAPAAEHYTIEVQEGARGYGPETLFGSLVTSDTTAVRVVDPAMRRGWQLRVLLRLCEVVLRHAAGAVIVELRTVREPEPSDQMDILQQIAASLHAYNGSKLVTTFGAAPHTPCTVALSNGALVRCSRGLAMYRTQDTSPWAVGMCDLELCPCHAATIDYFIPSSPSSSSPTSPEAAKASL